MKYWRFLLPLILFVLAVAALARPAAAQTVTACVDHYPPYHVWDNTTGTWGGINIQLLELIAVQAELDLKFTQDIPFKRCLTMMKNGSADLMAGLLYDPDRAAYMELIPYRDISNKVFVTASPDVAIRSFDDLAGLRIGVLLGHKYFPGFDDAKDLFEKVPVAKVKQLLAMLASGRTDAVIMSETHFLGLRNSDPGMFSQLRLADFSFQAENRVHVGVSLNGQAVPHIDRLRQAIETLRARNALEEVIERELGLM